MNNLWTSHKLAETFKRKDKNRCQMCFPLRIALSNLQSLLMYFHEYQHWFLGHGNWLVQCRPIWGEVCFARFTLLLFTNDTNFARILSNIEQKSYIFWPNLQWALFFIAESFSALETRRVGFLGLFHSDNGLQSGYQSIIDQFISLNCQHLSEIIIIIYLRFYNFFTKTTVLVNCVAAWDRLL